MAKRKKRLSMRKINEVLRLYYERGLSQRQIAKSCRISSSTVSGYIHRFESIHLQWPLPGEITESQLVDLLFPKSPDTASTHRRSLPDMATVHQELRRKGVTLQLLWEEYRVNATQAYQYSQFCNLYRRWVKKVDVCMRQVHRAGEKLFVDYAGQTIDVKDPKSGNVIKVQLFVAVLGASNYTYAEATLSQKLPDWIQSHINAFEYFDGVTQLIVPDNLKSGVKSPCRYEPDINPTYQDMASHYGTAVIPTRIGRPKDKAKVEIGVQIAERWILAVIRHQTFFSLSELNQAIRKLLHRLNHKPFKKLHGSRAELFCSLDKPALQPLPPQAYEYAQWSKATANIDYHVEVDRHYYSVPFQLVRHCIDVRLTRNMAELFYKGKLLVVHQRSWQRGGFTTLDEHRPKSHRDYLEWTPQRIINWAGNIGPNCSAVVEQIIKDKPHPEQGYRSCLGIIRLAKVYGNNRMEAACKRALYFELCSYKRIQTILKNGLDAQVIDNEAKTPAPKNDPVNIRGAHYYK